MYEDGNNNNISAATTTEFVSMLTGQITTAPALELELDETGGVTTDNSADVEEEAAPEATEVPELDLEDILSELGLDDAEEEAAPEATEAQELPEVEEILDLLEGEE